MISPVISVTPQTPIMRASALMIANRIRRLPVLDQGKLVGIIGSGDVCYEIFKKAFHLD
jgi:CBS domain-containing protein